MDQIPPYEYGKYVLAARGAVLVCSSFELLLVIFNWLESSCLFSKFVYFVLLVASNVVTVHNIALNIDGRQEIQKALNANGPPEDTSKSAALVLAPLVSSLLLFLCVSGHFFFSLLVLIHLISAVGQLGIELLEWSKGAELAKSELAPAPQQAPEEPKKAEE